MKIHYILTALATLLPLAATTQNLDPTVEVSRAYEGKLMEVHKPQLKMEVPDTVRHFDLDFDYSVTDTPYRGAYEFRPYSMDMRPSPTVRDSRSFYLRAGAGYQLHPELDVLWSPNFKTNAFRMDVYAGHRSFFGSYWLINRPDYVDGTVVLDRMQKTGDEKRTMKGFDVDNRLGVRGRADWAKGMFTFDVGYHGIMQESQITDLVERYYDALDVKIGLASKKDKGFVYKIDASYNLSNDDYSVLYYTQDTGDHSRLKAYDLDVYTTWGYAREKDRFLVDLGLDLVDTGGMDYRYHNGTGLDFAPRYVMESGRWLIDLGVRLSMDLVSRRISDVASTSRQIVYPDVRIEYQVVGDAWKMYLDVGGDSRVNSYSDLLEFNRHINPDYCNVVGYDWEMLDISEERVNAVLGAEARIGKNFSFNLRGGYVKYGKVLMDGLGCTSAQPEFGIPARLKPGAGYGAYDRAYAAFDWLLDTESVRFDGTVEYGYSWSKEPEYIAGLFLPAALKGDAAFMYDWNDRIFVGVDCEFSTAREGSMLYKGGENGRKIMTAPARIPGYADLGLNLGFAATRKMSFWARGGNLLGMTVQESILYAERGPYFTAGITLNL